MAWRGVGQRPSSQRVAAKRAAAAQNAVQLTDSLPTLSRDRGQVIRELLSGVTVACAQVGESVAFAFIAHVGPLLGLHAAWISGLTTGALGSRPAMINGATGVRAAVMAPFMVKYGNQHIGYVFWIVLVISFWQFGFAVFQLTRFIKLVPRSAMVGFCNGLAIVLAKGQVGNFERPATFPINFVNCKKCIIDPFTLGCYQGAPPHGANVSNGCHMMGSVLTCDPLVSPQGCARPDAGDFVTNSAAVGDGGNGYGEQTRMWIIVWIAVAAIVATPKVPHFGKWAPKSLVGILIATFIEHVIFRKLPRDAWYGGETQCIGEVAHVAGGLPKLFWSDPQYKGRVAPLSAFFTGYTDTSGHTWDSTLSIVWESALIAAAAGAVECVMTMEAVSDYTETENPQPNQQIWALGIGNLIASMFGTMGGGATIGTSVINCQNGANGHYRLSGCFTSFCMLIFILVGYPVISLMPVASLVGVMIVTIYGIVEWWSIRGILCAMMPANLRVKMGFAKHRKMHRADAMVVVMVTALTLIYNLASAVLAGMCFMALAHAWDRGWATGVETELIRDQETGQPKKIYHVQGGLFFSSAQQFVKMFDTHNDPDLVEIDFSAEGAACYDHSSMHSLNWIGTKYLMRNKAVHVTGLDEESLQVLNDFNSYVTKFTYDGAVGGGGGKIN